MVLSKTELFGNEGRRVPEFFIGSKPPLVDCYVTDVFTVAELFFVLGSNVFEVVLALSVIVLPAGAVTYTTNVSVTLAPTARLPSVHFTGPLVPGAGALHFPEVMVTLLNVVPAGVVSLRVRLLAASGPRLSTTIVYVRVDPLLTEPGAELVSFKSADEPILVTNASGMPLAQLLQVF